MSPLPAPRRAPPAAILVALLIASCSSVGGSDAPGCSGARRPANPHGSVLAPDAGARLDPPAAGAGPCRGGRP
ncbi:MAG: hypothetical protein EPO51_11720 [Phenylobacterium sp.]|uniref:hypothetical protein n=1 Tax=Phenylobacterium sp. TaxID=1871053 RepID=UPI00122821CE|nr:hypothetical protein [Phenylobacterium sp.]TAJ71784.1 MAG: hypothetical protein EPO51_11720 [Phenylobacterium sp.]